MDFGIQGTSARSSAAPMARRASNTRPRNIPRIAAEPKSSGRGGMDVKGLGGSFSAVRLDAKAESKAVSRPGPSESKLAESKAGPETHGGGGSSLPLGKPKGIKRASVWAPEVEEQ